MAANWGVVEERDDAGKFIAYHIMPMVDLDGEPVPSGAHELSDACSCHPNLTEHDGDWDIWNHHDPEHPGSEEQVAAGLHETANVTVQ
jgi:hypothetical protein